MFCSRMNKAKGYSKQSSNKSYNTGHIFAQVAVKLAAALYPENMLENFCKFVSLKVSMKL